MSAAPSPLVRHRYLVLGALGLAVYVAFLGRRDLWYPDEPDIGQVALAMYTSGDWIAPRFNGEIWVDYPPMVYWTASIAAHVLGGMSELALRLPSALAAIALVLVTCAAASRWFDARTGLWAGFLLAISAKFMYEAISYRPDMLFSLAIGAGIVTYATASGERARWGPRIVAFSLFGLAILSKGPLGLLLPGLVLTLWHAGRREWRRLLELAPLALVSLAFALPWYVACAKAMGVDDLWGEIYAQNFKRFGSGSRGHRQPFYYYLGVVWPDLAPWSPLLPFALYWLVRSGRWRDRHVQLALWWCGAFFVFLSIAITKRELYLMPAFPALALLAAPWFAAAFGAAASGAEPAAAPDPRPARVWIVAVAGLFAILGVVLMGAASALDPVLARADLEPHEIESARSLRIPVLALGAALVALGAWIWSAYRRGRLREALARVGVAHLPLYALGAAWILPSFNAHKTYAPQCRWIAGQVGDSTHIGVFSERAKAKKGGFGFYTGKLVEIIADEGALERFFREHPDSVALVAEEVSEALFASERTDWKARVVRDLLIGRYHYFVVRGA